MWSEDQINIQLGPTTAFASLVTGDARPKPRWASLTPSVEQIFPAPFARSMLRELEPPGIDAEQATRPLLTTGTATGAERRALSPRSRPFQSGPGDGERCLLTSSRSGRTRLPYPWMQHLPEYQVKSRPNTLTKELLGSFLEGDRDAERRLFALHRDELLQAARGHRLTRVLAPYTSTEDVVDEVFLRALSSDVLRRFEDRGRGSLRRTLFILLDRTLKDACRRHGALKRGSFEKEMALDEHGGGEKYEGSPQPTPTSQARFQELMAMAQDCLDSREWQVWTLTAVDGLTSRETGRRLDIPASTVRNIGGSARNKLILLFAGLTDSDT